MSGDLAGDVRTGATFADAAAEWLRFVEHDRMRKASAIGTHRSLLGSRILPVFAELPLESTTSETIESWITSVDRSAATRVKLLAIVHGIFQRARKVWGLKVNPAVDVEKPPLSSSEDIEVFSPEESGRSYRCGVRAGCRDLSHRRVHRAASRRASRLALARR